MQYFLFNNFIFLKNLILYLKKFIKPWYKSFINVNFSRNYGILYILKILNKKLRFNKYYNNYFYIFYSLKKYLLIANKILLVIIYNL